MALNIPMPDSPGNSLLKGLDTGSSMMNRLMQSKLEEARLKQQQDQFVQNLALQKQAEARAQTLLPLMVQQYQDTHKTAASEAEIKNLYSNILKGALAPDNGTPGPSMVPGMPPQVGGTPPQQQGGQLNPNAPPPPQVGTTPQLGGMPNATPLPDQAGNPVAPVTPNQGLMGNEYEIRSGNPRLSKLDSVAGLVPGIPKPVQHISNGMVFTTYPSGRMTAQKMQGVQTPGQLNVSAKEASKIRDQATALINSANLVQQGYDLLDKNDDLTGVGSGLASALNLSSDPELGKFTTVTGKLQAELGKYAASRGGIQAVKWAGSVKPSAWKPEDYNYGMFEGIDRNLKDDYNTLNEQYRAATGEDLPVKLPDMKSSRGGSSGGKGKGKGKVIKWKMKGGQLVKE